MSLVPVGGTIRIIVCPLCDRQFRGGQRNVNKIMQLHLQKTHLMQQSKKINNLEVKVTQGFRHSQSALDEPIPNRTNT